MSSLGHIRCDLDSRLLDWIDFADQLQRELPSSIVGDFGTERGTRPHDRVPRESRHTVGAYRKGLPVGEAGPSDAAVEAWEGEGGR
jgi:hypothetical protein